MLDGRLTLGRVEVDFHDLLWRQKSALARLRPPLARSAGDLGRLEGRFVETRSAVGTSLVGSPPKSALPPLGWPPARPESVGVAALPHPLDPLHPGQDAGVLEDLDRLGDGRAGAVGRLGDPLIGREAESAPGVMEGPQKRLQHDRI
jgi:hypothetical protein